MATRNGAQEVFCSIAAPRGDKKNISNQSSATKTLAHQNDQNPPFDGGPSPTR